MIRIQRFSFIQSEFQYQNSRQIYITTPLISNSLSQIEQIGFLGHIIAVIVHNVVLNRLSAAYQG